MHQVSNGAGISEEVGDWFPDEPLPDGWPTHDDEQKNPLSLCEIVNNALGE